VVDVGVDPHDVKQPHAAYGENAAEFAAVTPPRDFIISKDRSLTKLLDWFRFKEHLVKENAAHLIELYKSFSCEPLFMTDSPAPPVGQPNCFISGRNAVPTSNLPFARSRIPLSPPVDDIIEPDAGHFNRRRAVFNCQGVAAKRIVRIVENGDWGPLLPKSVDRSPFLVGTLLLQGLQGQ
jgi:hypothetical protein